MRTIPTEIKSDGTKILAKIGGLNMPLSEDIIKKHCGHKPKTEMEAKVMARRLKNRVLDFPNISLGTESPWDKRQKRIERRKRREANLMKVTIKVEMEEDYDDSKVSLALLNIEEIKKVKSISKNAVTFELERKGVTQKIFEEKIYPEIKEKLPYVKDNGFQGHDFMD